MSSDEESKRLLQQRERAMREMRNRVAHEIGHASLRFEAGSMRTLIFTKESIDKYVIRHVSKNNMVVWELAAELVPDSPPAAAEWLIGLFAPRDVRDALLGDLEERFVNDRDRFGSKFARRRYLLQAMRSTGPLLLKKMRTAGLVVMLYRAARWLLG